MIIFQRELHRSPEDKEIGETKDRIKEKSVEVCFIILYLSKFSFILVSLWKEVKHGYPCISIKEINLGELT
ncbi:hypothetical protein Avbf_06708 [Armadillidium vulgare]|nr:hypothetical protein Avbf_06708 [Armadillidium vulgare]